MQVIDTGVPKALNAADVLSLILGAALPENVSIMLDPALSADGKWSGFTEAGTAGATLAFGDICYQASADDRWELAKADAASTSTGRLGICVLAAAGDGSATNMLLFGKVRADTAFPSFTKYAPVYISSGTGGDLTTTIPSKSAGHIVRVVGWAISADEIWFEPDGAWGEYA